MLLAALPACLVATTSMSSMHALLAAVPLLLFYWRWYALYYQQQQHLMLTLSDTGELYWFGAALPSGQLQRVGLVSQYLLRLRWYSAPDQRCYDKWVWADQCTDDAFRTLARVLNQRNWPSERNENTTL
nr:protein YgfX [Rheinheimera maricola]